MNTGWHCPGCGSYHSPDVQTCPQPQAGWRYSTPDVHVPVIPTFPPGYMYGFGNCCCSSEKCRREGCQSRMQAARDAWASYRGGVPWASDIQGLQRSDRPGATLSGAGSSLANLITEGNEP